MFRHFFNKYSHNVLTNNFLTHWHPAEKGNFQKKHRNARGFAQEFLWSSICYRPGQSLKRHGKSCSLHSKKHFLVGGCRFFVSNVTSRGLLGHLGPLYLVIVDNRKMVVFP